MKQFENSHNVMESGNHSKNKEKLKNLTNWGFFLVLFVAVLTFTSCTQLYYVKSPQKKDEISISPNLKLFLLSEKSRQQQISVVLRTPRTTSNITQEVQNSEIYNSIERNLMNAGYTVRDRALLEKLVMNEQLSYESIAEKIKVDLIIEILESSRQENIQTKMFRREDNKEISFHIVYS